MILSPYFVFIHVPKTGGTWLREMFNGFSPWEMDVMIRSSFHRSFDDVPSGYQNAKRFTILRNPWDWYVSKYEYYHQERIPHTKLDPERWSPLFKNYLNSCRGSFEDTLPFLLDNLSYKWSRHSQLPANCDGVHVIRFENMREELVSFFQSVVPATIRTNQPYQEFEGRILSSAKKNSTDRGDYRDYYTPKLQQMVAEHEADLIEKMGFVF